MIIQRTFDIAIRESVDEPFALGQATVHITVADHSQRAVSLLNRAGAPIVEYRVVDGRLYEPLAPKWHRGADAVISTLIHGARKHASDIEPMHRALLAAKREGLIHSQDLSASSFGVELQAMASRLLVVDGVVHTPTLGPVIAFSDPPPREGQKHDHTTQYGHGGQGRLFLGNWTSGDHAVRDTSVGEVFSMSRWQEAQQLSDERAQIYSADRENLHPDRRLQVHSADFDVPDERSVVANLFCERVLRKALSQQIHNAPRSFLTATHLLRTALRHHLEVDILKTSATPEALSTIDLDYPSDAIPAAVQVVEEFSKLPHAGTLTMKINQWADTIRMNGYAAADTADLDTDALGFSL